MLAQPLKLAQGAGPLAAGDWVYERKLDGLRCIAVRRGRTVGLWSRNRLSFDRRFPSLLAALRELAVDDFALDGEIVAFEGERTSFSLLHAADSDRVTVLYYAFDLTRLLDEDTTGLALTERSSLLGRALESSGPLLRVSEQMRGDPLELLASACRQGWEGLVAKRAASLYRPGRSADWRKLKCSARQELVVVGWTEPAGTRTGFGALLLGYFDDAGAMHYAGKVGTGFGSAALAAIHQALLQLETGGLELDGGPTGRGIHWSRPAIVAEIEFTEWTPDGRLRHPSFLGLRPDKDAREVRREDSRYPDRP